MFSASEKSSKNPLLFFSKKAGKLNVSDPIKTAYLSEKT
jgi:hypothetical protein